MGDMEDMGESGLQGESGIQGEPARKELLAVSDLISRRHRRDDNLFEFVVYLKTICARHSFFLLASNSMSGFSLG